MRKVLKEARKDRGLTQKKLALSIGTSQQRISLIETGSRKPTIIMAKNLENFFKIPMEILFPDIFL